MKIAYCVKSTPAPHLNHPDVPLFMLGVHLAGYDYLLPEIRFKRNAYGVDTWFDGSLGVFNLRSSRDPNIVETLDVFDGLRNYVASQHWSQIDIDRVIIGSTKDVEAPIRPSDATGTALKRHIRGTSDEMREMQYAATLEATPESVKETMLRVLDANEPRSSICVVSSREKINEANERLGNKRLTVSEILP